MVRRPALLTGSYAELTRGRPPSEDLLRPIGEACGRLLFPGPVAARVQALLAAPRPGDRLDVVVEAGPGLLGLPFEAARLPVPGRPLLVAQNGVTLVRRPLHPPDRLTPALPGPLKVLVAIAAPDEGKTSASVLDGERELGRILDALDGAGHGRTQAQVLEVAGLGQITKALRQGFHVLHLSGHGTPGGIELEDEDGNPVPATAEQLAEAVLRGEQPLPLVFLSCCDRLAGEEDAAGLAERLLAAGLGQIVAMQGSVSDAYATELAARFYDLLADSVDAEPARALALARRDLELERQKATPGSRPAPGAGHAPTRSVDPPTPPEYATASLFCAGVPQPIIAAGDPQPLTTTFIRRSAGPVPQLGEEDLVGRRVEVREAVRVLCYDQQSVARLGRKAAVALYGIGGVGKSSIAGRVMTRLRERGWVTTAVAGPLDLDRLCQAVRDALDPLDDPPARQLVTKLGEPVDDELRLSRLGQALTGHRLLLVLDNFEDNLVLGGGSFTEPATEGVVGRLLAGAGQGRLLITSRYPVPGAPASVHELHVGPLSRAQTRKLLLRLRGLAGVAGNELDYLLRVVGGHPRLLELVDALLRGDASRLGAVAGQLRALAADEGIDLSAPRTQLADAVEDAVQLGARHIFLTQLVDLLSPFERDMLLQAAVSNLDIDIDGLAFALTGGPPPDGTRSAVQAAARTLADRSLLTPMAGGRLFVHRWTADGLRRLDEPDRWRDRARRAADQRRNQFARHRRADDAMEAARNLLEAEAFEEAATLAAGLAAAMARAGHQVTLAAFAGEILARLPLDSQAARRLAQLEADANEQLGFTGLAADRWHHVIAVTERLAEAEPDRADYQRDLSISYNKLGDLMVAVGRGEDATRLYTQSLDIRRRLAEAEPDRADYQRDLPVSLYRIASTVAAAGDQPSALSHLAEAIAIGRRAVERAPDAVDSIVGLAFLLQQASQWESRKQGRHLVDEARRLTSRLGPEARQQTRVVQLLELLE